MPGQKRTVSAKVAEASSVSDSAQQQPTEVSELLASEVETVSEALVSKPSPTAPMNLRSSESRPGFFTVSETVEPRAAPKQASEVSVLLAEDSSSAQADLVTPAELAETAVSQVEESITNPSPPLERSVEADASDADPKRGSSETLPSERHPIFSVMVNESGPPHPMAREFSRLDLTVRGAISIARRLQDPLELVKVHPKSIDRPVST